MAIDGINSLSEAIKVYNNPNTSKDVKREILAKYPDVVKYVGKDNTEYKICDEDFDFAKEQGAERAKDSTNYDGHKSYQAVGDAVVDTTANILGQTVLKNVVANTAHKIAINAVKANGATNKAACAVEEHADFILGCTLGLAEGIKYTAQKPNEDQVNAARALMEGELPDAQAALGETQDIMEEAEEEFTELSEEAENVNEDANDKIDKDKTQFDFYRAQYNALKEKAESGEKLTKEERALMNKLAPMMQDLGGRIQTTQEETSDKVSDLSDDMEKYQDTFDESAEVMADVEGVTDFAEGFDETTQIMCYVEGGVQTLNAGMSGYSAFKAGKFAASGGWLTAWAWAFAAMGTAGAYMSGKGAAEQFKWAKEVGNEIDRREELQDFNSDTNDIYEEKLDTYTGQVEMIDDLELEVPEDLEIPVEPVVQPEGEGGSANTLGMQPTVGNQGNTGNGDGTNGNTNNTGSNTSGAAKTAFFGKPLTNLGGAKDNAGNAGQVQGEQNPSYVNKMGNGSDWSGILNGNIGRNGDNDIVTDSSGKVVLIKKYADAITSETGAQEGEFFTKDNIPKILAKVLGYPFDAKMIQDIRNGKQLDDEYASRFVKTKTDDESETGTVDNSKKATEMAKKVIDFYYPIFLQASTQGWVKGKG